MKREMQNNSKADKEFPLVTLALITYNQENFIEEALHGAVKQDYKNLEIIVSDDFSSDRTYKLIEDFFQDYKGPHKIIINRNIENLGIGRHINKVNALANGELVVAAAGDDVSFDNRVSVLVQFWLANGKPPAFCSQAVVISANGRKIADRFNGYDGYYPLLGETRLESIKRLLSKDHCILLGCTEAWVPEIFQVFGPLDDRVVHEDNVISLRAWLLGSVKYLTQPLVKYRTHEANVAFQAAKIEKSVSDFVVRELKHSMMQRNKVVSLEQHMADLKTASDRKYLKGLNLIDCTAVIEKRIQFHKPRGLWWNHGFYWRFSTLIGFLKQKNTHANTQAMYWMLPRLFGVHVFATLRALFALTEGFRR